MGIVAQLYDLQADEAMRLTDAEANYLLETAQINIMQMAMTSPAMKEVVRQRLEPAVRQVREARKSPDSSAKVGAPPPIK